MSNNDAVSKKNFFFNDGYIITVGLDPSRNFQPFVTVRKNDEKIYFSSTQFGCISINLSILLKKSINDRSKNITFHNLT